MTRNSGFFDAKPGTFLVVAPSEMPYRRFMLWTLAVILMVLWAVGLVSSYTMGGFIHLLIVAAVVIVALRLITGKKVIP